MQRLLAGFLGIYDILHTAAFIGQGLCPKTAIRYSIIKESTGSFY